MCISKYLLYTSVVMQLNDCFNSKNHVRYSSVTFSKYIKLLSRINKNIIFENYEIEKINKRFHLKNNKIKKKFNININNICINKKKKIKIKMENKFILLKKIANRPDKIGIHDTRSKFCFSLVNIKDMQKSIDVPILWKTKKKFLIGNKGNENSNIFLKYYVNINSKIKKGFKNFKNILELIDKEVVFKTYLKFGEYFYEGKNLEKNLEKYRPGVLSENLREALGISTYSNPPWILNFKKFGLPPSYFTNASSTTLKSLFLRNSVTNIQIYYNLQSFRYWGDPMIIL
uniref:Splicing factor 3bA n=1 Tax=Lotharella vacuolata TaxID=74820 RepID=A0A0H5BHH3_9EUKA|nr:splicing factor 3bA [Lotharella vacuolata]